MATSIPPFGGPASSTTKITSTRRGLDHIPVVDLDALQQASRVLQEQFVKDAQMIFDIGELLTAPGGQASASYSVTIDDTLFPFQKRRLLRIPESLWQFYTNPSNVTHMGLMPEIERVWITIDHKLFLWDYVEGVDLCSFVGQPDVITHVTLVKPKPGVFIDDISYILVICTVVSVLLIGVSATNVTMSNERVRKEIKLYATDMIVPSEVTMGSVIGTKDGRIFMCGSQDGNLYELHYQEKEGWFGKKVHLINHSVGGVQSLFPRLSPPSSDDRISSVVSDNIRGCFYTLSAKGTISVYKTASGKSIELVQIITGLYKLAQEKAPGAPALAMRFSIIGLHVVHPDESRLGIQLVAVTANGLRLYLSPSSASSSYPGGGASGSGSPRSIHLIHVRLPPTNCIHPDDQFQMACTPIPAPDPTQPPPPPPQYRTYVVSSLDSSCYSEGITICAEPGDNDGCDFILCTAPDLTSISTLPRTATQQQQQQQPPGHLPQPQWTGTSPYTAPAPRPPLTEYAALLSITGRTWAIEAFPRRRFAAPPGTPAPLITNELATQFSEPARHIMILTDTGLSFIAKRRALDYLRAIIEEAQAEGNIQRFVQFKDSFGRDQTCCMLLGIASGNSFLDNDVPLGIEPGIGNNGAVSPDIASMAKQAFYDFGERPVWSEHTYAATGAISGNPVFSGRREGLVLYFARLVRPFWKAKLTKAGVGGRQQSNVADSVLIVAQKNLYSLKDFLDTNPQLFHSSPGDIVAPRAAAGHDQDAWMAEQDSVSHILSLLARTIEAISFFLLLNDFKLGELVAHCELDIQKLIGLLTFEELITTVHGQSVSRALVNVVIDQQIGQQISVDTISEILQQRCGSFCSTDDVLVYKAKENVRKAVETRSLAERQNLLSESLRLFTKGARILGFEKLREIVGDYQQLNYAKGAIELPITCAQIMDPYGIGVEFWAAGSPANDPRAEYYERRLLCYDLALDSLSVFERKSAELGAMNGAGGEGKQDADTIRLHAYQLTLASEDPLFHSSFYDWLIGKGLADELLDMRTPFLEDYLRKDPITLQKYQLLWQFYIKNNQPLRAAEVLAALAETTQIDISLDSRLEYLTLAVGNAKSHPMSIGRHETAIAFLTELEEKLDVAQVQLEIFHTLFQLSISPNYDPGKKAKIALLGGRLYTMSELYQDYAEPFDLPTVKLLILHVSEHRDDNVVRPIWNQIFEEAIQGGNNPRQTADLIRSRTVPLGKRFHPSESAFPLRHIATLLVRFALANKGIVPIGWAPRVLVECGVPYQETWDVLHEMYESQIPPFNDQSNIQAVSSDIAVLLSDWLDELKRPQTTLRRDEFPFERIEAAVNVYMRELDVAAMPETLAIYERIKRGLRRAV